jgi:hypothetical protein
MNSARKPVHLKLRGPSFLQRSEAPVERLFLASCDRGFQSHFLGKFGGRPVSKRPMRPLPEEI